MKTTGRIKLAATVASLVRAATRPGGPSVAERVQAVPRLVRATLDGTYAGTTVRRLGLVAGALAYVASPIDLLPELLLPVVGAADDALVIGWAIKAFVEETDRFVAWERGQGSRAWQSTEGSRGSRAWQRTEGSQSTAGPPPSAWAAPSSAPDAGRDATGAAASHGDSRDELRAEGRGGLPEGVRQAATDYVMESVRKRLER